MPITMAYKLTAIVYGIKTGEKVLDHVERRVIRRQQEAFANLNGKE